MGPKIEAALDFVSAGGAPAACALIRKNFVRIHDNGRPDSCGLQER
jgi:carbamate kinase